MGISAESVRIYGTRSPRRDSQLLAIRVAFMRLCANRTNSILDQRLILQYKMVHGSCGTCYYTSCTVDFAHRQLFTHSIEILIYILLGFFSISLWFRQRANAAMRAHCTFTVLVIAFVQLELFQDSCRSIDFYTATCRYHWLEHESEKIVRIKQYSSDKIKVHVGQE